MTWLRVQASSQFTEGGLQEVTLRNVERDRARLGDSTKETGYQASKRGQKIEMPGVKKAERHTKVSSDSLLKKDE